MERDLKRKHYVFSLHVQSMAGLAFQRRLEELWFHNILTVDVQKAVREVTRTVAHFRMEYEVVFHLLSPAHCPPHSDKGCFCLYVRPSSAAWNLMNVSRMKSSFY